MLFVSEKHVKRISFIQMLRVLPKFFTNKHIRNYCLFLLTKFFFIGCFEATYDFICIEKGYNYDYVIIRGTIMIPFIFIVNIIGSRWLKTGFNQRASIIAKGFAMGDRIGKFILYKLYKLPQDDLQFFIGITICNILFMPEACTFTYELGFVNDIADPAISGLYITFISCFINVAVILPNTLGTFVITYMDYEAYMIACLIGAIIYWPFAWYYACYLDSVDVIKYRIYTGDDEEYDMEETISSVLKVHDK